MENKPEPDAIMYGNQMIESMLQRILEAETKLKRKIKRFPNLQSAKKSYFEKQRIEEWSNLETLQYMTGDILQQLKVSGYEKYPVLRARWAKVTAAMQKLKQTMEELDRVCVQEERVRPEC